MDYLCYSRVKVKAMKYRYLSLTLDPSMMCFLANI